jgi:hypothetical protein
MRILIFSLLIALPLMAQVQVQVLDPDIDTSSLEKKYQVHRDTKQANSLPNKELRDQLFQGVTKINKYDELKKDIFFMDLKRRSIPELLKKYPEFSMKELKSLKDKLE